MFAIGAALFPMSPLNSTALLINSTCTQTRLNYVLMIISNHHMNIKIRCHINHNAMMSKKEMSVIYLGKLEQPHYDLTLGFGESSPFMAELISLIKT